tara:strand:+ start:4188 stop:5057 length:870 start_codon:yes stop_codon:yes gene_type:complete
MKNKSNNRNTWLNEYIDNVSYGLKGEIIIEKKSDFQKITIFESIKYGKTLLLDGCFMTSEKQERSYHEAIVHPALCGAETIENVLIIGGGDGGTARECLRYSEVQEVHLIEIDEDVVNICKEYLPEIGSKAWTDKRLKLIINDGIKWVSKAKPYSYDVIIVDGSDPKGPSEGLFNKSFFENCKRILKPNGIFATQSESPESFLEIHVDIIKTIRSVFRFADPLYGFVPIYPSGWWSWTFGSNDCKRYLKPIEKRVNEIEEYTEIWSKDWQEASFKTIPNFLKKRFKNDK